MTKRLFVCRVQFEYAVVADSEIGASFTNHDEDVAGATTVEPWNGVAPAGWDPDTIVYGADPNLTLREAIEKFGKNQ